MNSKLINIFLLGLTFAIALNRICAYYDASKKSNAILNELNEIDNKTKKSISSCEVIYDFRSNISWQKLMKSEFASWPAIEYKKNTFKYYMANIEREQYKLSEFFITRSDYLPKELFKRDRITSEILIGSYEYSPSKCVASELSINGQKFKISKDNNYIIPKSNVINIEYRQYSLDIKNANIDTFLLKREIVL